MISKQAARQAQIRRSKECAVRQAFQRRQQLLYDIAIFCAIQGTGAYDLFTAREAVKVRNASLHVARRAFRRAKQRIRGSGDSLSLSRIATTQIALVSNRPATALSRQNRSGITLALPRLDLLNEVMALGVLRMRSRVPSKPSERKLPGPATRRYVVLARDIAPTPSSRTTSQGDEQSDATAQFWRGYLRGTVRYEHERGENVKGEISLALFSKSDLRELLPGVIVPRAHQRAKYLTNLRCAEGELCLDVFAADSLRPLFRHYFAAQNTEP